VTTSATSDGTQVRDHILAIVGHDLRNPLGSILLAARCLQREAQLSERGDRALSRITGSAERMQRMIADLLDYARAGGGGLPIARQPVDLADLCRDVLDDAVLAHPGRTVCFAGEPVIGDWDPDRVTQLITNLVENALQYSPQGSVVSITARDHGELAVLAVHNHGEPIPLDAQAALFEPFRRGPQPPPRSDSLGLGLYIARQIVHGHGGLIDVRSLPFEGTTFIVRLPRRACALSAAAAD
jgi:signal transduction histidine kinase